MTLRIFFMAVRFKVWRAKLGKLTQVYLNPYGLELILDPEVNAWGLFLDEQELYMNLHATEVYQVAKLKIQDQGVFRLT